MSFLSLGWKKPGDFAAISGDGSISGPNPRTEHSDTSWVQTQYADNPSEQAVLVDSPSRVLTTPDRLVSLSPRHSTWRISRPDPPFFALQPVDVNIDHFARHCPVLELDRAL